MNYKNYLISKDLKINKAMEKLDTIKPKILFVADNDKLVGALTDGDIRRYFIAGGSVNDLVIKACNLKPKRVAYSLEEAELMLDKNFIAIPVIDKDKNIIDIYIGNSKKTKKHKKLNVPVVINAGGKGTRLEPFTSVLPKPLIPIGEYPIIEHIMQRYEEYGCDDFKIIVNYKKEIIKSYFKETGKKHNITWVDENIPLGTGGGLSLLKNKIKDTFFFINCDNLLLEDYEKILKYHKKNKNDITMICASKNFAIPYGIVDLDEKGNYQSIKEKPNYSFLTNTAIYVVEPTVLKDIKKNTKIDFPDIVNMEKEKGRKIGVYVVDDSNWLDMGVMPELEKMRKRLYGE